MGVPTEVWRQRIGTFTMPASGKNTKMKSHSFSTSSSSFGVATSTFLAIIITVVIGMATLHYFLPTNGQQLCSCGDIEINPGPDIHTDILKKLTSGDLNLEPLSFTLKNKHFQQLLEHRTKCAATWLQFTQWLKALIPNFPDDPPQNWSKRITTFSTDFKKKRQAVGKSGADAVKEWEELDFKLPSVQGSRPRKEEKPSFFDIREVKIENEQLSQDKQELAEKYDQLKKENEELKSRPTLHEYHLQGRRESYHRGESSKQRREKRELERDLSNVEAKRHKAALQLKTVKRDSKKEVAASSKSVEEAQKVIDVLQKAVNDLESKCEQQSERIKELLEYNAKLKSKLKEPEKVNLTEKRDNARNYSYTDEARKCIYKLLGYHISFECIGPVIETVLNMVGKTADRLPVGATISQMNKERLLIAQYQLKDLAEKENLTIATDETPKAGDIYMTYTITAESGDSYVLGLREMLSKSAENTLETFKTILDDITEIVNNLKPQNEKEETGLKILCQIKNTMSDRAATETLFNSMLQAFREECLPLFKEGWEAFNDETKQKLIQMNNFYCGLHLLVSMAEVISTSFKDFEELHLDGTKAGAKCVPGINVLSSESGTIRTVRTTCKALAKGADEKSGCHRHWKTYKTEKNISKSYLQNFRGNRFNIVFLLGGCVYHLRNHITNFLTNVHGTSNGLLKAVAADIVVPVHIAGCKVLGLLNKLVTAPLWRITEKPGHILDMCNHYTKLSKFLKLCIENDSKLEAFARGNLSWVDETNITKDEVFETLIYDCEHDSIVLPMLKHTLMALSQLVNRVTNEFQEGGKFHLLQNDSEFRTETMSAPTHNKLPERVFGYLDFLIHKRPNVSALANEAQIMFVFNKTDEFINNLTTEEFGKMMTEVTGPGRKELVKKYKEREQLIQKELAKKQLEKEKKLVEQRENEFRKREELTSTIIDAGLWQSEEHVNNKMSECDSDSERCRAIKKQIQFRRKMLCQYLADDKKFNFTRKEGNRYVDKPWIELRDHLLKFINAAKSVGEGKSVQKTVDEEIIEMPLIVGRNVIHQFLEDGKRTPYKGYVISQVPGFLDWFNIKYDNDDHIYTFRLVEDYRDGNLEILPN